jgi:3-hydroxyisobutyrate dehydrogenase-like beta-hydroxyacid dehydrogenase
VLKLTANMILAANISLFGQVYALNERWGIDHKITDQLLGVFYSHPGLVAYAEHVRDRDYVKAPGEGFGVEGGLKDVNAMLATGEEVGVPLPFCGVMREQFISTIGHGMKDMEWSALGDAARLSSGVSPPTQEKK